MSFEESKGDGLILHRRISKELGLTKEAVDKINELLDYMKDGNIPHIFAIGKTVVSKEKVPSVIVGYASMNLNDVGELAGIVLMLLLRTKSSIGQFKTAFEKALHSIIEQGGIDALDEDGSSYKFN